MLNRRRITAALIGLLVLVIVGWLVQDVVVGADNDANGGGGLPGVESGLRVEPLSALPEQASQTWELIEQDGPFPFPDKDGGVFGNREKLLPLKESGYYREYTVSTEGSQDRGPRRLVTGETAELYYTADHYSSFVVVDPRR